MVQTADVSTGCRKDASAQQLPVKKHRTLQRHGAGNNGTAPGAAATSVCDCNGDVLMTVIVFACMQA